MAAMAGLFLIGVLSLEAADQMTGLYAKPGSKMRLEGTSTIHDWQAESKIIGGSIQVGPNFPTEPGQDVKPGKVDVKGEAFITVLSLMSVEKNGSHYSDTMDDTMWKNLKAKDHPKIFYRTSELTLKEVPKSKDEPYLFESKGELVVAGVTNQVSLPLKVLPLADKKVKISGSLPTKMSNFGIKSEDIGAKLVPFKTANDVKFSFDWIVGPAKAPAAAANK
jgi:hypothetical protein